MHLMQSTVIFQEIKDTFIFEQVRGINPFHQGNAFYGSQSRGCQLKNLEKYNMTKNAFHTFHHAKIQLKKDI